jgi:hypothetical protein
LSSFCGLLAGRSQGHDFLEGALAKRVPPVCKREANRRPYLLPEPTRSENPPKIRGSNSTRPRRQPDSGSVTKGRNSRLAVSHSRTVVDRAACLEMSLARS